VSARRKRQPEASEPLAMTDAEVAAMARGEKEIARRIARHSPTKPTGKLVSDKPAPPQVSVAEMEEIQRSQGRLSTRLRERLQSVEEADVALEPKRSRKAYPAKEPPKGR
jgi:DNA segregation ATPase FtsK/SpoIIIE-like protein